MSKISIHDTHRLPFFNATVTAKQLSDSTTPVQFKTFTGEIIGLSVKTNARGFICRTDGTPYTDGVFVGEDAIVTATLGDGSSTSWVVGKESEIVVYDGNLYGAELPDDTTETNVVVIGSKKYKKLFSANQQGDSQLSLNDLADVPSFTKWTDDQQIETLDLENTNQSATITMGIQTKTLLLEPKEEYDEDDNDLPVYPKFFTVYLQATLDEEGETRFGRNFVVSNFTTIPIVLVNTTMDNYPIGTVEPGQALEITETYPSPNSDTDGGTVLFRKVDNGDIASNGGILASIGNYNTLTINEGTPSIITISELTNTPDAGLNITIDTSGVTVMRRIVIRRMDEYTKPINLYDSNGAHIGTLRPNDSVEVVVATNYVATVNSYLPKSSSVAITLTTNTNLPMGCPNVSIDCSSVSSADSFENLLLDIRDCEFSRLEFSGATRPIWIVLKSTAGLQGDMFCIPSGNSRVCIQNICGIGKVIEKSWSDYPTSTEYSDNNWKSKYASLDIVADCAFLYSQTGEIFAFNRGNHDQDLYLKVPISDGETRTVRIRMPFYSSTIESGNAATHLRLGDLEGNQTTIESQVLFTDAKMDEDSFIAGGWTLVGTLTRSGTTITFTKTSLTEYK